MTTRLALLSVHTSPLARLGGSKTGGMNVYVRELAQEFGRRGIAVDIFTRRADPASPGVDYSLGQNVRVIYLSAGPDTPLPPDDVHPHLAQFTAGLVAFAISENVRYDLIYAHYWLSGLVASSLREMWGTPFVQMFHTLGHMKNRITPSSTSALAQDVRIINETKMVQQADAIIAATPAEQAQLLWLYRADRRKIAIVPPGVNPERFHPISPEAAKAHLGVPPGQKLLLFVGRIEPLKGVDSIMHALHDLTQRVPDVLNGVKFVLIGGDPDNPRDREMARLRALSADLGLQGVVIFEGAQEQSRLPYYYAASQAVIMPSDYESFGMVALEAMACGVPVIASQVGGLAFLVQDGQTGFLVPVREPDALADRISHLLSDPALRARLGAAAAARARDYTWPAVADRLVPLFDAVSRYRQFNRRMRSEYQPPSA